MTAKNPSPVRIIWREWDDPNKVIIGEGVEFIDEFLASLKPELVRASRGRRGCCVAFFEDFRWLHGSSNEVVIHIIRPDALTPEDVLCTMKERIEEIVGQRELPVQQITPKIYARVSS